LTQTKFVADDSARLIAAAEEIGKVEWPLASLDNGITFSCVLAVSANLRWPHSFASLQLTALETFARLQHRTNRKEPDMRTQHIVLPLALAIGGLGTAAGAEEYRGTWEQQMACTPDVWRLCGDQIPDVNRIVACLQQNTPNLSSGCRAVFQSNNSVPQAQAVPPRGRALPPPARNAPPPTSPSRPSYDDDDE
jgi:hypothetical protein